MLKIGFKRRLVFELHDAAEGIALSSRRDVWAHVGLKQSGDHALEGGDFTSGSILLSVGCPGFPLKCEGVKDSGGLGLRASYFRQAGR